MNITINKTSSATPIPVRFASVAEATLSISEEMLGYLDEAIGILKQDPKYRKLVVKLRDVERYIKLNIGE